MLPLIALLVLGLLLLVAGGESLVRGSSALARRSGVPVFIVGLTIVAFGTSAPELVVAVQAVRKDSQAIALGNVLGSNIANIGLILGVCALVHPISCASKYVIREALLVIIVSAATLIMFWDGALGLLDGVALCLGFMAFLINAYQRGRRQTEELIPGMEAELKAVHGVAPTGAKVRSVWFLWVRDVVLILAGLGMLIFGGELVVDGAVKIAESLGVSQRVIGLTIVAIGTSLPELAVGIVAAVRRHPDMVIGNVLGSNMFNILLILGVAAVVAGLLPGGEPLHGEGGALWLDLIVVLGMALACLPVVLSGGRITRTEGLALLLAYIGYLTLVNLM